MLEEIKGWLGIGVGENTQPNEQPLKPPEHLVNIAREVRRDGGAPRTIKQHYPGPSQGSDRGEMRIENKRERVPGLDWIATNETYDREIRPGGTRRRR